MVVGDFDVECVSIDEQKADAPLVIDGNRMLPLAILLQGVQAVPRWNFQIIESCGQVDVLQFANGSPEYIGRETLGLAADEELLGAFIRKRLDHLGSVPCHVTRV